VPVLLFWPQSLSEAAAAPVTTTPIEHVVVLMDSGRSFDHYFGAYPGADGIPVGVCARVTTRKSMKNCVQPFPLRNRPLDPLPHDASIWRHQYDGGRMDGFVSAYRRIGLAGTTAMGYYDDHELPFLWNMAENGVLFNRFFGAATTGKRLNRFYWVTGGPTPLGGERVPAGGYGNTPTIFDRLQKASVSWKFYVEGYDPRVTFRDPNPGKRALQLSNVPLLNFARFIDDPQLSSRIVDLGQYSKDLAAGTLPAVSYIATNASSEAPPGSPAAGQRLVQRLTNQLEMSRFWRSSAFVLTYDGWGGFYDHVPPPQVDQYGYGFRVPTLLLSPYAAVGQVNHTMLDSTGILRFIEDNWRLPALSHRDAASPGIMSAFDFKSGPRRAMLLGSSRAAPVDLAPRRSLVLWFYGGGGALALLVLLAPGFMRTRAAQRIQRRARLTSEGASP
jgi:phospholipase C